MYALQTAVKQMADVVGKHTRKVSNKLVDFFKVTSQSFEYLSSFTVIFYLSDIAYFCDHPDDIHWDVFAPEMIW